MTFVGVATVVQGAWLLQRLAQAQTDGSMWLYE